MAEFDRVSYFSNVVRHVEELNAKYKVVDIPLVLGDFLIVIDAINDKDAEVEDQILASLVFATGALSLLLESIDDEKWNKLGKVAELATATESAVGIYRNIVGLIKDLDDPKNNGSFPSDKVALIINGSLSVVNNIVAFVLPDVAKIALRPLVITLQVLELTSAIVAVNANSLKEEIEENIESIKLLHDRFSLELENRSSSYISTYNNAVQKASEISGLSIEELAGALGDSLTVEAFIKNVASDEITDFKNRLNRAEEYGLNESYDEAKAAVEMWIGEGTGDKGQFDALAETQITIWLKTVYQNALDKLQSDILSDTHSDTFNTINAQLAGIINGYSHIDEADKAAILAGWQQKFAGEFALERNGSDSLLLDEITRLKAEMARLGAGEGTSILDMPNPNNGIKAKLNSNSAFI